MAALVRYEAACRAVAEARTVDEVKDLRDKADAMRVYARQAKNRQLEIDAAEIRVRAERRLGEMISEQKRTIGLNRGLAGSVSGSDREPVKDDRPTLSSIGINKKLSSRAQKLAEYDGNAFERLVARWREHQEREADRITLKAFRESEYEEAQSASDTEREEGCSVADLQTLISAGKKFGVIYADPPWEFRVYSGKGKQRSADRHYPTQSLDFIKQLPIAELAAENCALLMWAVMPELPGALDVIRAWGFEYKTVGFTWVKQNRSGHGLFTGMGYWTRANAELCMLATRGSPKRQAMDVPQVVMSPVSEHSKKPDEVQVRIERLLPGPYLELFARRTTPGWTVWGNDITRNLFHQSIPEFAA